MSSRVSVIIPMYQSEATVEETVRSVLADEIEGGVEIVVVNDGSRDEGPTIVERLAREDARIRLIQRENGGLGAARNTGIEAARGAYVRFLDADDWTMPGATERLIEAAEEGGTGAACGTMELRDARGRSLKRSIPARHGPDRTVGLEQLLDSNAMGVGTVLLRRDVLGERRFRPFWGCEDYDLWARLALAGVRFAVVGEPAVKAYRLHAASMSKRFDRMCASAIEVTRGVFRDALEDGGWTGRVDLSSERLARAGANVSLGFASMAAACGKLEEAVRILDARENSTKWEWSGADVGVAFVVGVVQGLAMAPEERGAARELWVAGLLRWFEALEHRGALAQSDRGQVWGAIAGAIVTPERVADLLSTTVQGMGVSEAVLVGFGRNGRLLAGELAARGISVRARDGRWPDGRAPASEMRWPLGHAGWNRIKPESMDQEVGSGIPVVVTPNDDAALLRQVGSEMVLSWRDFAAKLVEAERADLAAQVSSVDLPTGTHG